MDQHHLCRSTLPLHATPDRESPAVGRGQGCWMVLRESLIQAEEVCSTAISSKWHLRLRAEFYQNLCDRSMVTSDLSSCGLGLLAACMLHISTSITFLLTSSHSHTSSSLVLTTFSNQTAATVVQSCQDSGQLSATRRQHFLFKLYHIRN